MSIDDHIIARFGDINAALREINSSINRTNKTVGRVEALQETQAMALCRVEKQLETVTGTTTSELYGLREVTGQLQSNVVMLESRKMSRHPGPLAKWKDILTAGNFKLILLILLFLSALIAGVSIPANVLSW